MSVNLIPFPRLHFFITSTCVTKEEGKGSKTSFTPGLEGVEPLISGVMDHDNLSVITDMEDIKSPHLTSAAVFRGNLTNYDVECIAM